MSGSNLPPGVTESMIPGNRPEDAEWDAFYDWFEDQCVESGFTVEEVRLAVTIGFSGLKGVKKDLNEMFRVVREDERQSLEMEGWSPPREEFKD